jgi:hypothetical protein
MACYLLDLPVELLVKIGTHLELRDDWQNLLLTCKYLSEVLIGARPLIDVHGHCKHLHNLRDLGNAHDISWVGKYTAGHSNTRGTRLFLHKDLTQFKIVKDIQNVSWNIDDSNPKYIPSNFKQVSRGDSPLGTMQNVRLGTCEDEPLYIMEFSPKSSISLSIFKQLLAANVNGVSLMCRFRADFYDIEVSTEIFLAIYEELRYVEDVCEEHTYIKFV